MCCRHRAFSFVIAVSMLDLVVKASVNLQVISQSIFGSWLPEDWCGWCPRWGHWLNRPTWKVFKYSRICYKYKCIPINEVLRHKNHIHEVEPKLHCYSMQPSILDYQVKKDWAMSVSLLLNQQTPGQHDASEQLTLRQDDVIDSKSWTGTFCGWSRLWGNAYTLKPGRCLACNSWWYI